jgi:hypothetical protein
VSTRGEGRGQRYTEVRTFSGIHGAKAGAQKKNRQTGQQKQTKVNAGMVFHHFLLGLN